MKSLWIDDVRPAPKGWIHLKTVEAAIDFISKHDDIAVISIDHDAGDYVDDGGDYIKLLDWMVETERFYPVKLHTMNPVGRESMQRMIDRYWGGKK